MTSPSERFAVVNGQNHWRVSIIEPMILMQRCNPEPNLKTNHRDGRTFFCPWSPLKKSTLAHRISDSDLVLQLTSKSNITITNPPHLYRHQRQFGHTVSAKEHTSRLGLDLEGRHPRTPGSDSLECLLGKEQPSPVEDPMKCNDIGKPTEIKYDKTCDLEMVWCDMMRHDVTDCDFLAQQPTFCSHQHTLRSWAMLTTYRSFGQAGNTPLNSAEAKVSQTKQDKTKPTSVLNRESPGKT